MIVDLDPELLAHRREHDDGSVTITHPLVYSESHRPEFNEFYNAMLRNKRIQAACAFVDKDWKRFIELHAEGHRLDALAEIEDHLTDKQYWRLLGELYCAAQSLWRDMATWRELLSSRRRHSDHMMTEGESRRFVEIFPGKAFIYRGYSSRGTQDGLSWTTNSVIAGWYATRCGPCEDSFVAHGWVYRTDVIAYLERRFEYEVVVLPERVHDIRTLHALPRRCPEPGNHVTT